MAAKTTKPANKRIRVQIDCSTDDRTHQSFKDECDINSVMERHRLTGIARGSAGRPQYGDFSNLGDYQQALDLVAKADQLFGELPAKVRGRFNNNPDLFVQFCDDPENAEEAVKLGIAAPPPKPEIVPAEPVPEPENNE